MQVSTGPLLNTENKESSENRRTERQENEKSVWTGRSKPGVKVHLSLYITSIVPIGLAGRRVERIYMYRAGSTGSRRWGR